MSSENVQKGQMKMYNFGGSIGDADKNLDRRGS